MSSFTTSNVDVEKMNIETVTLEEAGPAGDCVISAKADAEFLAAAPGGSGDPMYYYTTLYRHCFYAI